jgi:hypothetical protein
MSYSIDKNSLLYKTLEFNEKYLLGGGIDPSAAAGAPGAPPLNNLPGNPTNSEGNGEGNDNESKSILPNAEERAEARRQFFESIVKVFGAIMYLLYLPLIPWIKITKSVLNNMGKIFNGTLMPL